MDQGLPRVHRVDCVVRGYTVGRQSEVGYPGFTGSVALCGGTLWADSQKLGRVFWEHVRGSQFMIPVCRVYSCTIQGEGYTVEGWRLRV
jgi:hypothetical protein